MSGEYKKLKSTFAQKLTKQPMFGKVLYWVKLVTLTGVTQATIQGTSIISGILIIRFLTTNEYAYYTIANTMLGTMVLLSDGGITNGVMAQGSKVWEDNVKLGQVLSTGLKLRKIFCLGSMIVVLPILVYLLIHQGAGLLKAVFIGIIIVPSFMASLSDNTLSVIPKIHQDIKALQYNQLIVGIIRLILSVITVLIYPIAAIVLLANGLPRIYGNIQLRNIAYKFADNNQVSQPQIEEEILKIVKRSLPGAIYYSLSGQISIWLISIFGKVEAIASLGAIGRISVLINLLLLITTTLVIPRFSKIQVPGKLFKMFITVVLFSTLFSLILVIIVQVFSSEILWVLGGDYNYLNVELILSVISSAIGFMAGTSFLLHSSKGWIMNPVFSITINILAIVFGIYTLDISSLKGVLLLNIVMNSVSFAHHTAYGCFKVLKFRSV